MHEWIGSSAMPAVWPTDLPVGDADNVSVRDVLPGERPAQAALM